MSNLWKAPKLPQRAMLHAKAIYNEHFVIVKDRTIPNRRTFYLSPVFHDTDDFVRVTFIRPTAATTVQRACGQTPSSPGKINTTISIRGHSLWFTQ